MNQKTANKQHRQLLKQAEMSVNAAYAVYYVQVRSFLKDSMTEDEQLSFRFTEAYILSQLNLYEEELRNSLTEVADTLLKKATELAAEHYRKEIEELNALYFLESLSDRDAIITTLTQVGSNVTLRIQQIIKRLYRQNVLQVVAELRNQRLPAIQLPTADEFLSEIEVYGLVAIIDRAGRKWKPDVYTKMYLITQMMELNKKVIAEVGKPFGHDLARIAGPPVDNPCNKWIGTVISMTGKTEGYVTYQQVKDTGECFHPNCQHFLIPLKQ